VPRRRRLGQRRGQAIAPSLLSGERKAVLLGNAAAQHPQAATLLALALDRRADRRQRRLPRRGGNTVGAQLVGAMPGAGGLNAGQMLGSAAA
jgi:NADH-quinone oxidoreductase subunit G